MKKYKPYIIHFLCLLFVAALLVGQYLYLSRDDWKERIYYDSSLPSLLLYDDDIVQRMAKEIMETQAAFMPDYKYTDYCFSVDMASPDEKYLADFPDGTWVRIRYSCNSTYVVKPEKDPYILGMKEVMEETNDPDLKAIIQDYMQDGLYWREDAYGVPDKQWSTVYAFFDKRYISQATKDSSKKVFELYHRSWVYNTDELALLREDWPARDAEDFKEMGRQSAEALALHLELH